MDHNNGNFRKIGYGSQNLYRWDGRYMPEEGRENGDTQRKSLIIFLRTDPG